MKDLWENTILDIFLDLGTIPWYDTVPK